MIGGVLKYYHGKQPNFYRRILNFEKFLKFDFLTIVTEVNMEYLGFSADHMLDMD